MSSSSSTMRMRSSAMCFSRCSGPVRSSESYYQDGVGGATGKPRPAAERVELDEEGKTRDSGAEPLDELDRRGRRAAGREDVVHDESRLTGRERVGVHLERVGAVLESVGDLLRPAG